VTVRQEDRHHHQRGAPAGESFPSDDLVDGPTGIAGGQLSGAPAREAPPGTTVWQQARSPRGLDSRHTASRARRATWAIYALIRPRFLCCDFAGFIRLPIASSRPSIRANSRLLPFLRE
jgi:hypothetical protein